MKINRKILYVIFACLIVFGLWYGSLEPKKEANWQEPLDVQAQAVFNGESVTIKNVRNFRYDVSETEFQEQYYDREYDLNKIFKIWYIVEPFKAREYAAHTFLSFEFEDKKFLTISIEARKKKGQDYSLFLGMLKTYPLMYIASDERDSIYMRTKVRQNKVFVYPVKASPKEAKILFEDMLLRMNELAENPVWYNTFFANCTSAIAYHVNKIWPERLPKFLWQSWITGYAEELAFKAGLIDTNLQMQQAREKYYVTDVSNRTGDVEDYSEKIRQGF